MLQLETATEEEIGAFFVRWPRSPLADRLRVEWLKVLGKRGQWSRFAGHYPPPAGEDVELACYGIQFRRQRDGDAALADAKPVWFTGQATPESCAPLFAALIAKGDLTVEDRRARFRLATEAGGGVLVVSQFTLLGDARKGNRPSFVDAAGPEAANALYERVCALLREKGLPVATGVFRAEMEVELVNDGPVTILLDSRKVF
jgi:D-Tyr-tRNAtyr deacylase